MEIKSNERLDDLQFNNLQIIQEVDGYCFTSDAIALANYAKVYRGETLVDLCSGSGVIGILAHFKSNFKKTYLVELQENLANMSQRTLEYNNIKDMEVLNCPLQGVSSKIGLGKVDCVVCNPPYKKGGTATKLNENESVAIARHELTVTLEEIVKEASRLLKFGGLFYTVNKEERLADLIVYLRQYGLEPKELKIRRSEKGANIILLKAKKGGKSGMTISLI